MLYINIGIVKRNQHSEIVQNVNSYSINRMKKRRYRCRYSKQRTVRKHRS